MRDISTASVGQAGGEPPRKPGENVKMGYGDSLQIDIIVYNQSEQIRVKTPQL